MRLTMPQAQTPLGAAVQNIAQAFLSGPSPIEQEQMRMKNDYMRANTDKARGEATKIGRENTGANTLADLFRALPGTPDSDPNTMAAIAAAAVQGGGDPKNIAEAMRFYQANRNAPQQVVTNSMLGAGNPMASTPTGFGVTESNKLRMNSEDNATRFGIARYQNENAREDVVGPDGRPVVMRRGQAFGNSPILTDSQVQTVPNPAGGYMTGLNTPGAPAVPPSSQPAPFNYVTPTGQIGSTTDAKTDLHSGAPLPAGTTRYSGQVQAATPDGLEPKKAGELSYTVRNVKYATGRLRQLANQGNIGAVGDFKGAINGLAGQASAVVQALGYDPTQLQSKFAAAGLDPTIFNDPGLGPIDFLSLGLAYDLAGLRDPGGRKSNDDVKLAAKGIYGKLLQDAPSFFRTLDEIDLWADQASNSARGGAGAPPPQGQTAPQAAPATGPAAAPQIFEPPRATKRIDLQGNEIVR